MLTEEEVKHVAKLARINLTDDEVKKFSGQLSDVLDYMKVLDELDVSDVPEASQVTGLSNVTEKDEIIPSQSSREELLDCTQLPVDSKQVRVMDAIK